MACKIYASEEANYLWKDQIKSGLRWKIISGGLNILLRKKLLILFFFRPSERERNYLLYLPDRWKRNHIEAVCMTDWTLWYLWFVVPDQPGWMRATAKWLFRLTPKVTWAPAKDARVFDELEWIYYHGHFPARNILHSWPLHGTLYYVNKIVFAFKYNRGLGGELILFLIRSCSCHLPPVSPCQHTRALHSPGIFTFLVS